MDTFDTLEERDALAKALHAHRAQPNADNWGTLNDLARPDQHQVDDVAIAGDDLLAKLSALPETDDLRDWTSELVDVLESATPDQSKVAELVGKLGSYVRPSAEIPVLRESLAEALRHDRPLVDRTDWTQVPPARMWLVPGHIPAHRFGMLTGQGGRGKSTLALALALAVCIDPLTPTKWLLQPVQDRGPVIICTWEDEPDEISRRLGEKGRAVVGDQLHVVDLAEYGPTWAPSSSGSGHTSTLAELTAVGHRVRGLCERVRAKLLVIDPLAAAFASNENDRGLVRAFVSSWDGWARRVECSVLAISHPPKDRRNPYAGTTDWEAASRWMATLRATTNADDRHDDNASQADQLKVLEFMKSNYGLLPPPVYLKWANGGYVYDGERYPAEPPDEPAAGKGKRGKRGKKQTAEPTLAEKARQAGLDIEGER